jgi:hypothetical protein
MAQGVINEKRLHRFEGEGAKGAMVISKRLIDIADSNAVDMAVDATTPKTFRYTCPVASAARIHTLSMAVDDTTCIPTGWGAAALSNGIFIKVYDSADSVLVDLCDGVGIKSMHQMSLLAGGPDNFHDVSALDTFAFTIDFNKILGEPLLLGPSEYIGAVLADNLSGLSFFEMWVHGVYHITT